MSFFVLDFLLILIRDLISSRHAQTPNMYEIQLQLHSVSTGLFHPEAKQPIISVVAMPWQQPAAGIEIVGDNLVLILTYYTHEGHPDDQVFIYKWKTGELKMVRDLQPASAPYLMLVRASLRHSVRILVFSFLPQTLSYSQTQIPSNLNTGRFLRIMHMWSRLDRSLLFLSRSSKKLQCMIVYRAAQTPTLHRLTTIVRDHFTPIHTMQSLSSASPFTSIVLVVVVMTRIISSYLSIAALSSSVWIDTRLVSHMTETRNPFHTLNGVNQYADG